MVRPVRGRMVCVACGWKGLVRVYGDVRYREMCPRCGGGGVLRLEVAETSNWIDTLRRQLEQFWQHKI